MVPEAAATPEGSALSVDASHAEVFDFEEFLDAVFGALAADAALLHPAERGDLGRDDAFVDADDAVFERFGDMRLDLLDRLHVDQRADHRTRLEPVGDLHGPGGLREALIPQRDIETRKHG